MRRLRGAWVALALLVAASGASAQVERDKPVFLTAETLTYDQELGVVTATGNVEIVQGDRVLLADTVSYGERDGKVTASGNVSLLEPTGEVLFADYAELRDEMQNGFIQTVRLLLADNSRLAANRGERRNGNVTTLDRAVFSPCNLCPDEPERGPLWQIKAVQVVHNQEAKRVEYKDASLEFFGVPVAYTPYFSHPDPTVRRQSGVLQPTISNNNFFGVRTQVPYFWAIDDNRDATITPQVSTKQGLLLAGEYRERTRTGEYELDGSVTNVRQRDDLGRETDDRETRGHIRGAGRFRANDDFLYGFRVFRTTDDTYLRRFAIRGERTNSLTSRLYTEGYNGRSFLGANAYAFQGLRPDDDPGSTPILLPLVDYQRIGEPNEYGARLSLDANVLNLYRTEGTDTRRLSVTGSWQLPYYAPAGDVYTLTASLRGDAYSVDDDQDEGGPPGLTPDGFASRVRPLVALDWRFPLVRPAESNQLLIEPIAQAIVTPYGGNEREIPNEDSITFEYDDTNLFAFNRFPGLDRYEGGPRLNYGMRTGVFGATTGFSELLVGQTLRLKENKAFAPESGLFEQKSDYVARLTLAPSGYFSIVDRVRIDEDDFSLRRHEITASVGPPAIRFSLTYARLDRSLFFDELQDREALSFSGFARLSQYWSVTGSHLRDLEENGGSLNTLFGLRYTDECFDILFFGERTFTTDRDLRPTTTFGLRFRLVTLG